MKKITYIFSNGRIKRINNKEYAEDFFYGYRHLSETKLETKIIEFKKLNPLLKLIEHNLSKIFSLPLYIFSLLDRKNINTFKNSDYLLLVSESAGFAALPLLVLLKKRYKIYTSMYVMGLFSKNIKFPLFKNIHFALIKYLASYIDKLYFLGHKEYEIATRHLKNENKLVSLPFYVDTQFWTDSDYNVKHKDKILFIGNDGNRNYDLLISIAKKMKHRKFIFVSSNPKLLSLELENIEIIKGSWSNEHLSDKRLKDIYTSARMVILPLKNSTQPSGQSVTLQAMSLRVPVLISLTDGFWDTHNFIEDKNIFFERENTLDSWVDRIDNLFIDTKKLDFISKNSSQLIKKNYDIEIFNKFMINEVTQRQ